MLASITHDQNVFPDYWRNGTFEDLQCVYYENGSHWLRMWDNPLYGHQMELLSHVCVNGSFSHLSLEEWDQRCYPTKSDNTMLSKITGYWSLLMFLTGFLSNLLTLMAVPYATYKRRYGFHRTFWTTDIWILHLSFCELLYCIFFHPHYFTPSLGYRYPQGIGSGFCTIMFVMTILSYTNDWLLVSIVAMTRVIALKYPDKWENFCDNKIWVFSFMLSTWIFQALLMLPIFLQTSIDIGYNCLMGKCNYIPTGQEPIASLAGYVGKPQFIGHPFIPAFLIPCLITIASYVLMWMHMNKVQKDMREFGNIGKPTNEKTRKRDKILKRQLTQVETKFIWTVFIICLCYFLCAIPGILFVDILQMQDAVTFLVALSFVWIQFSINVFIYAFRSEKYRCAYMDIIVLIFPCAVTAKKKIERAASTQKELLSRGIRRMKSSTSQDHHTATKVESS